MPESRRHKQLKTRDARSTGWVEYVLPSGRRLDALSPTRIATEIERGGISGIRKSIRTLKEAVRTKIARKSRLRVPHKDLDIAYKEMRRQGLGGELTNLGGTVKIIVPRRRKRRG